MTVQRIIAVYPCVMWDGTNLEEIQGTFTKFHFGQDGDTLTVFGPGFTGNVSLDSYLYGSPPPANMNISFTNPVDGTNFILAQ